MPDDTVQPGASTGHADAALVRAVAAIRQGWIVLRGCELAGGDGDARARVDYALLHPDVGIALLDVLPGATTPDAPDLLRRSLDAGAFPEMFGGYPPIVHLRVRSSSFPELGSLLAKEFARLRPLALAPRKAWVGSAQRVLTAEPPLCGQAQATADGWPPVIRPPGPARAEGRRASPPDWRRRGLGRVLGRGGLGVRRRRARPAAPRTAIGRASRPACRGQPRRTVQPPVRPRTRSPGPPPQSGRRWAAAEAAHTEAALRVANAAASDAGPPAAGRDHSEPAAPATPDGGPEWSLVHAAGASPHAGSAAKASAAMDATGPDAEAVGGTPVTYAPEGAAPSAGPSTTAAGRLAQIGLACRGIRRSADARHLSRRRAGASGHRSPASPDARRRRGASRRRGTRSWRGLKPPPPPRRA